MTRPEFASATVEVFELLPKAHHGRVAKVSMPPATAARVLCAVTSVDPRGIMGPTLHFHVAALVTDATAPPVERVFEVYPPGHAIEAPSGLEFVGPLQVPPGSSAIALLVFERVSPLILAS